jgi:hypothetical protein
VPAPYDHVVRRRFVRFSIGAVLAIAWAVSAGAYVERALACADMANDAGRAECCAAAKHTRFNGPNGDCCRDLRWIESESAATRAADPPPVAYCAVLPASAITIDLVSPRTLAEPVTDAPERPPPLAAAVNTTVLLI